jgi:methyl-accepting chemotaxis protein
MDGEDTVDNNATKKELTFLKLLRERVEAVTNAVNEKSLAFVEEEGIVKNVVTDERNYLNQLYGDLILIESQIKDISTAFSLIPTTFKMDFDENTLESLNRLANHEALTELSDIRQLLSSTINLDSGELIAIPEEQKQKLLKEIQVLSGQINSIFETRSLDVWTSKFMSSLTEISNKIKTLFGNNALTDMIEQWVGSDELMKEVARSGHLKERAAVIDDKGNIHGSGTYDKENSTRYVGDIVRVLKNNGVVPKVGIHSHGADRIVASSIPQGSGKIASYADLGTNYVEYIKHGLEKQLTVALNDIELFDAKGFYDSNSSVDFSSQNIRNLIRDKKEEIVKETNEYFYQYFQQFVAQYGSGDGLSLKDEIFNNTRIDSGNAKFKRAIFDVIDTQDLLNRFFEQTKTNKSNDLGSMMSNAFIHSFDESKVDLDSLGYTKEEAQELFKSYIEDLKKNIYKILNSVFDISQFEYSPSENRDLDTFNFRQITPRILEEALKGTGYKNNYHDYMKTYTVDEFIKQNPLGLSSGTLSDMFDNSAPTNFLETLNKIVESLKEIKDVSSENFVSNAFNVKIDEDSLKLFINEINRLIESIEKLPNIITEAFSTFENMTPVNTIDSIDKKIENLNAELDETTNKIKELEQQLSSLGSSEESSVDFSKSSPKSNQTTDLYNNILQMMNNYRQKAESGDIGIPEQALVGNLHTGYSTDFVDSVVAGTKDEVIHGLIQSAKEEINTILHSHPEEYTAAFSFDDIKKASEHLGDSIIYEITTSLNDLAMLDISMFSKDDLLKISEKFRDISHIEAPPEIKKTFNLDYIIEESAAYPREFNRNFNENVQYLFDNIIDELKQTGSTIDLSEFRKNLNKQMRNYMISSDEELKFSSYEDIFKLFENLYMKVAEFFNISDNSIFENAWTNIDSKILMDFQEDMLKQAINSLSSSGQLSTKVNFDDIYKKFPIEEFIQYAATNLLGKQPVNMNFNSIMGVKNKAQEDNLDYLYTRLKEIRDIMFEVDRLIESAGDLTPESEDLMYLSAEKASALAKEYGIALERIDVSAESTNEELKELASIIEDGSIVPDRTGIVEFNSEVIRLKEILKDVYGESVNFEEKYLGLFNELRSRAISFNDVLGMIIDSEEFDLRRKRVDSGFTIEPFEYYKTVPISSDLYIEIIRETNEELMRKEEKRQKAIDKLKSDAERRNNFSVVESKQSSTLISSSKNNIDILEDELKKLKEKQKLLLKQIELLREQKRLLVGDSSQDSTAGIDSKTDAFKEEGSTVDSVINEEIKKLDKLEEKLKEVKRAVDAKTEAFKEEGKVVGNVVDDETKALSPLQNLESAYNNFKSFYDNNDLESEAGAQAALSYYNAYKEALASKVSKKELQPFTFGKTDNLFTGNYADYKKGVGDLDLSGLNSEIAKYQEIIDKFNQPEIVSIINSLTQAIEKLLETGNNSAEATALLKNLNAVINNLGGKNSAEKIERVVANLANFQKSVQNLDISDSGFVKSLSSILEKGEELKALGEVLKSTKKQLDNAEKSVKADNNLQQSQQYLEQYEGDIRKAVDERYTNNGSTVLYQNLQATKDGLVQVTALIKDAEGEYKKYVLTTTNGSDLIVKAINDNQAVLSKEVKQFEIYKKLQELAIPDAQNLGEEGITFTPDSANWNQLVNKAKEFGIEVGSIEKIIRNVDEAGHESFQIFTKLSRITIGMDSKGVLFQKDDVLDSSRAIKKFERQVESLKKSLSDSFKDDMGTKKFLDTLEEISKTWKELEFLNEKGLISDDDFSKYTNYFNAFKTSISSLSLDKISADNKTPEFIARLKEAELQLDLVRGALDKVETGEAFTNEDIEKIKLFISQMRTLYDTVGDKENKLANAAATQNLLGKIADTLSKNSAMSKDLKQRFRELSAEIKSFGDNLPDDKLKEFGARFKTLETEMKETGQTGLSFFDGILKRAKSMSQSFISMYLSLWDIIRYIRQGLTYIKELDTALTEMRKVSDETVKSLKNFQNVSFDIASSIGTTAKEIQNSAADFMRLGYSLKEASELAQDANIYANVGDMEIDEATEHMISSIKAWGSEFNSEVEASSAIVDRYNEIGNNFAITSADIGAAMERSAAALKAGGKIVATIYRNIYFRTYLIAGNPLEPYTTI